AADDATDAIHAPEVPRIASAEEALAGAHVPTLDPATMNGAEIRAVLGAGEHCEFRYTSAGKPVLAFAPGRDGSATKGVVKLNGHLVALQAASTTDEVVLSAEPIRMTLGPAGGQPADGQLHEVNSVFQVGDALKVGYRGYYRCVDKP
ncbi:DUF6692 family protein, partial [Desertibaculum subflavum]|uniref:DUF6692 family protein n=1 Tax=Desertibaculum subflavum TaxID=2268458 RepID=UPI0034D34A18